MNRIFLLSLVILLMVANWAGAATVSNPNDIVIDLPGTYTVSDDDQKTVKLGELARSIRTPDDQTRKQFESLAVLEVPAPGQSTRLPNHYIIQSIRQAGLDFTKVRFTGERLVTVMGCGKTLELQDLIEQMKKQVLEETGWKDEELVLRILSAPTEHLWVPPQPVETVLERTSPMIYGTVRFEARLFIDNVQYKNFPIVASITHRRAVYMPTRTLERGDVIGKEDVREVIQYFDQEFGDRQTVDDAGEIIGAKCKTPLNRGDAIKWNNLDVNYVVNRGDPVKVVLQNKGMTMQTTGKALKRGAVGDVVLIKTDATKHIVKGRIIQRGLVELVAS